MIGGNGSLSGHHTAQRVFAWNEWFSEDKRVCGLFVASILTICLQPRSPPLKFLWAVHVVALLLCRHELFTLVWHSGLQSVCVYAAVVLGIQYSFAASNKVVDDTSSSLKKPAPPLLPLIFPCHTTHTRLFPSRHSFTYSYLFVGIPVGWQHDAGILSCDPRPTSRTRSWFSVHAEDYLARGGYQGGLRTKLDDFLRRHGVQPEVYPYAYLLTAPRFLGWSFNPVSFWYLYDRQRKLKAMILEVNNTFDERRMYLLRPPVFSEKDKFREKWQKDFHVSPFNDRLGDYSLLAKDPFETDSTAGDLRRDPMVDNTITLLSPGPDAQAKIVARVNSTSAPLDPSNMSIFQTCLFMAQWGWTGLLTNPRILREARVLWMKKKQQLFYRPEVNVGSISRQETSEEITLEGAFREWLEMVALSRGMRIGYISAAGSARGQRTIIDGTRDGVRPLQWEIADFVVEVVTPEWYAELARSKNVIDVFNTKCFAASEGEGLATVSEPGRKALAEALSSYKDDRTDQGAPANPRAVLVDHLRASTSLLSALLHSVFMVILKRPMAQPRRQVSFNDLIEVIGLSKSEIESVTLRILLADRLALGFTSLLTLYGQVIWMLVVYLTAVQYKGMLLNHKE